VPVIVVAILSVHEHELLHTLTQPTSCIVYAQAVVTLWVSCQQNAVPFFMTHVGLCGGSALGMLAVADCSSTK